MVLHAIFTWTTSFTQSRFSPSPVNIKYTVSTLSYPYKGAPRSETHAVSLVLVTWRDLRFRRTGFIGKKRAYGLWTHYQAHFLPIAYRNLIELCYDQTLSPWRTLRPSGCYLNNCGEGKKVWEWGANRCYITGAGMKFDVTLNITFFKLPKWRWSEIWLI